MNNVDNSFSKTVSLKESMWKTLDEQPEGRSKFVRIACTEKLKGRGVISEDPIDGLLEVIREAISGGVDVATVLSVEMEKKLGLEMAFEEGSQS